MKRWGRAGCLPEKYPLTARLGVSDFNEESQPLEESIALIRRLKGLGLDLIDVSIGFNTPDMRGVPWGPGFMAPIAERIRREADIATAVGWLITEPDRPMPLCAMAKPISSCWRTPYEHPHWTYHAAKALGLAKPQDMLPPQYAHWLKDRWSRPLLRQWQAFFLQCPLNRRTLRHAAEELFEPGEARHIQVQFPCPS